MHSLKISLTDGQYDRIAKMQGGEFGNSKAGVCVTLIQRAIWEIDRHGM